MIRITERWSLDETGCCAKNGQIRIKLRINISDLGQTHAGVKRAGDVEPEQRPVLLRHPLSSTRQKQRLCTAGIFGTFTLCNRYDFFPHERISHYSRVVCLSQFDLLLIFL